MSRESSSKSIGTIILDILPFVGAGLIVIMPFGNQIIEGQDFRDLLLSAALAAFFPLLFRLNSKLKEVNNHQKDVLNAFNQVLWLSDDRQRSLVMRAMRRGFFDGSEINDQF